MGKSFYSIAVYDIQGGEKMSVKLVVGILLLVSVLLAGPAQASQKIIDALDKNAGTAQESITSWSNTWIIDDFPKLTAQATATDQVVVNEMRERDMEEF